VIVDAWAASIISVIWWVYMLGLQIFFNNNRLTAFQNVREPRDRLFTAGSAKHQTMVDTVSWAPDINSVDCLGRLAGHRDRVYSVHPVRTGIVASGSSDRTLRVREESSCSLLITTLDMEFDGIGMSKGSLYFPRWNSVDCRHTSDAFIHRQLRSLFDGTQCARMWADIAGLGSRIVRLCATCNWCTRCQHLGIGSG